MRTQDQSPERAERKLAAIMLTHYYESDGRREDAQAIVGEMLSVQPEITAEIGVEVLARFWNEEWIPGDLEAQLRKAGLP